MISFGTIKLVSISVPDWLFSVIQLQFPSSNVLDYYYFKATKTRIRIK